MYSIVMQTSKVLRKDHENAPPPHPHIAMHGCQNGTIPAICQDKVVYAGFKRAMTLIDKCELVVRWSNVSVLRISKTCDGLLRISEAYIIQQLIQDCEAVSDWNTQYIVFTVHLNHPQWGLQTLLRMTWDRDDNVNLYLHIYENALSCTLIWLIAGRN